MITVPPDVFSFFLIKKYNFSYFSAPDFRLSVHGYCLAHIKYLTLHCCKELIVLSPPQPNLIKISGGGARHRHLIFKMLCAGRSWQPERESSTSLPLVPRPQIGPVLPWVRGPDLLNMSGEPITYH